MRGGKRQGAGRKQGFAAKSAEEARRAFAEMVSKEITPIALALIKQAKKGDIRAAQLLFDRAWGKSPAEASSSNPADYIVPSTVIAMEDRARYASD